MKKKQFCEGTFQIYRQVFKVEKFINSNTFKSWEMQKNLGKSVEKWKRICEKNETIVEKKKWNLILMIEFDVEKSCQKNWTPLWNAIYYALLKKTVNIEDYNFEEKVRRSGRVIKFSKKWL